MKKLFALLLAVAASMGTIFAESGTCGENLTWDLTNGILTVSGTGPMENFLPPTSADDYITPWRKSGASITKVVINSGVTTIGELAFAYCESLISVEIPNTVTSIGNYAFAVCFSLSSVEIPNSVTSIGEGAFTVCPGLTSVEIPNSVISIGIYAFADCSSLTSISIGNNVTSIGNGAFVGCSGLTDVTCYATTPPELGSSVWENVDCSKIPLYVPTNSVDLYKNADQWKEFNPIQPISTQSIEDIQLDAPQSTKILREGQLYILRGDHIFDTQGKMVR